MGWSLRLAAGVLVLGAAPLAAARADTSEAPDARSGVSIVETGTDRQDRRLFTVQADRADLADLLRTLFQKTGDAFTIAQDVSGPVDLKIRNATLDEVILRVAEVARPTLRVRKDEAGYHVDRVLDPQRIAIGAAGRMGAGRLAPGVGRVAPLTPVPLQPGIPPDRLVTLSIPDESPVPLRDVVATIAAQTRFSVSVDPRVPREVSFSGTITQASLPLVLQTIASTAGLKVVGNAYQAILAPTDRFSITVNRMLLGQSPAAPCRRCGQALSPGWKYCPNCGLATPRPGAAPFIPRR